MPTNKSLPVSVSWDQVAAFRLAQHHLVERAPKKSIALVTGDMTGAQAQLLSAAQMSLWSRIQDLTLTDIEKAMDKRTLVRAACMRRTLFLVPSKQLAVFVRGSARRAEKEIRWTRGQGVPDRDIDSAIEATLNTLDQPLTRSEIAVRVCELLGVQPQSYQGGGWGNHRKLDAVPVGHLTFPVVELLHLVGARGVVCYGPNRGSEPTFVRAEAWIPKWQDVPLEQAEGLLLRKYLQAYGPATTADFAMWAGITLTDAREIWAREETGLASVNVEGWSATILPKDLEKLVQAKLEQPVIRLLPNFDSFLLGHRERAHLTLKQHQPKIYRPQGWIAPVVLANGRVVAVWKHTREKNNLHLKVTAFERLSSRVLSSIRKEAQDLARFLGAANVNVQHE